MDATSTTRAGTEPVDLSGVPETMLPLCARAQHTLSPRPRFQDRDAVTLVSHLDHDVAAARTGRPTAERAAARALTQRLLVLRARCAPRPCTGDWVRQHRGSGTGVLSRPRTGGRVCWGSPAHYMAAASRPCTGGRALPYGVRGLQNPASHFRTGGRAEPVAELVTCTNPRPRTGGRDQGPVTGQTGERP